MIVFFLRTLPELVDVALGGDPDAVPVAASLEVDEECSSSDTEVSIARFSLSDTDGQGEPFV